LYNWKGEHEFKIFEWDWEELDGSEK